MQLRAFQSDTSYHQNPILFDREIHGSITGELIWRKNDVHYRHKFIMALSKGFPSIFSLPVADREPKKIYYAIFLSIFRKRKL